MKTLTVTEANQRFSETVRQVELGGETVVITRRGKPVAELRPITDEKSKDPAWQKSYNAYLDDLEDRMDLGDITFDRDRIYERQE